MVGEEGTKGKWEEMKIREEREEEVGRERMKRNEGKKGR